MSGRSVGTAMLAAAPKRSSTARSRVQYALDPGSTAPWFSISCISLPVFFLSPVAKRRAGLAMFRSSPSPRRKAGERSFH